MHNSLIFSSLQQQSFIISKHLKKTHTALIECDRQSAGRRLNSGQRGFRSSCGTAEQVSFRVGRCLDPLFDLIEGRLGEPRNDADMLGHCNRFNTTERCIRVIAKDCLSGIHKTATSAVSSESECSFTLCPLNIVKYSD